MCKPVSVSSSASVRAHTHTHTHTRITVIHGCCDGNLVPRAFVVTSVLSEPSLQSCLFFETRFAVQHRLALNSNPPASASQVLEIQVGATMPEF